MELRIDALGRIFLPKKLRERYGLKPNSVVQVSESDDGILLTQTDGRPSLKRMDNGLLIFTGGEKVDFDIVELIDEIREERHRRILGLDK